MSDYARRKEQELNESNGNNENLQAQIDSLKKKIRELEVCFSAPFLPVCILYDHGMAAYSRRICTLQSVLHVFSRNNIASAVENTFWKPLEMPFLRLWISKCPLMPRPPRTCAFGASSINAVHYSLSAWYSKTFWQPITIKVYTLN